MVIKYRMKFIKLLSYVERKIGDGSPMYLILMGDNKEYISYASIFIENTEENIKKLGDRKSMLDKLLSNKVTCNLNILNDIKDTSHMFRGCKNLETVNINLPNAINIRYMFENCENLKTVDINIPNVESTSCMFYGCKNLETIDINVPNAINVSYMFHSCENLRTIDINIPKAINAHSMFHSCENLRTIDINIPKVEDVSSSMNVINTNFMFENCMNLDTKSKILIAMQMTLHV